MDFTIYLFPISIGMFEQAKLNTVEEYLAPLQNMSLRRKLHVLWLKQFAHGGLLEPVPGYFEALQELCHASQYSYCSR